MAEKNCCRIKYIEPAIKNVKKINALILTTTYRNTKSNKILSIIMLQQERGREEHSGQAD